jgi:hypothetical protein
LVYSFVANTHFKGAADGGTTPAIDTTGADLIVLGVVANISGITAPTDSKSNTWTPLTLKSGSQEKSQIFYCQNPTTDAAHTFSVGGTGQFQGVYVEAFVNSSASPFDVENGATVTGATSLQPGSVSPSQDDELIVAFESDDYAGGSGGTQSIDSGFTITDQENQQSFTCLGASMSYLIQGAKAAVNPTWSVTGGNRNFAGVIAAFKVHSNDASPSATRVTASGAARAVAPANTVAVTRTTASGRALAPTAKVGGTATRVTATGVASPVLAIGGLIARATAAAIARAVVVQVSSAVARVTATGAARSAPGVAGPPVVRASATGVARRVTIESASSVFFPVYRLMRDTPVAAAGAMRDTAIAVIARLSPDQPANPASVQVFIQRATATGRANPPVTAGQEIARVERPKGGRAMRGRARAVGVLIT